MHLFIFLLKYLLTYFSFKHILTVEWNEKYALQYEKQKSLTQFWAIMGYNANYPQTIFILLYKEKDNKLGLMTTDLSKCLDANKSLGFRNSN